MAQRISWNLAENWDSMYSAQVKDKSDSQFRKYVGYGRKFADNFGSGNYDEKFFDYRWRRLSEPFEIESDDRILVVGCGFGYLIEAAKVAGFPNVYGVDSSSYIADARSVESSVETLFVEDDIREVDRVRDALRSLTGDDSFDWIITESVLESFDDPEISEILNSVESFLDAARPLENIVHLVDAPSRAPNSAFNIKTLTDWKALRSYHSWVATQTFETL